MELMYTIQRSPRRRRVTITVERDRSVVVHAPEGTSDERIRQVVESKRQWIYEKINHPQKYRSLPHPPGKELVNGESVLYLGRQYRIEIVETTFLSKPRKTLRVSYLLTKSMLSGDSVGQALAEDMTRGSRR
jgi:predicted metal-dependent hydrolase